MQDVLITGGRGLLGSSIKELAESSGWSIQAPTSDELDLRDMDATFKYLSSRKIGTIIHCAAKVGGIQANIDAPADFILENSLLDSSVISSARKLGINNFIYFGSSCMYPKQNKQPMAEEDILTGALEPTNEGYALAKIMGAKSINAVSRQDGLNWKVLIPSNLYGPRDNFDERTSHLIPAIIRKISKAISLGSNEIEIWGSGNARREFTYVEDVARFVIDNLASISKWKDLMNIGFGKDYSINDYYKSIGDYLGFDGIYINDHSKAEGMFQKLLDSSTAKAFGWDPKIDLGLGIERTVNWYRTQLQ